MDPFLRPLRQGTKNISSSSLDQDSVFVIREYLRLASDTFGTIFSHSFTSDCTGRGLEFELDMRAAILVLVVVLALAVDLSAAAQKKKGKPRKFCPQEVGTDRCTAKE